METEIKARLEKTLKKLDSIGFQEYSDRIRHIANEMDGAGDPSSPKERWPAAKQDYLAKINNTLNSYAKQIGLVPKYFQNYHEVFTKLLRRPDPIVSTINDKTDPELKAFWDGMDLAVWKEGEKFVVGYLNPFTKTSYEVIKDTSFKNVDEAAVAIQNNGPLYKEVESRFLKELQDAHRKTKELLEKVVAERTDLRPREEIAPSK